MKELIFNNPKNRNEKFIFDLKDGWFNKNGNTKRRNPFKCNPQYNNIWKDAKNLVDSITM